MTIESGNHSQNKILFFERSLKNFNKNENLSRYRIIKSNVGFKIEKITNLTKILTEPAGSQSKENLEQLLEILKSAIQKKEHHDYKKIISALKDFARENNFLYAYADLKSLAAEVNYLEKEPNYSKYNVHNIHFEKTYIIVAAKGLSAGANGSVERIVVEDKNKERIVFAMKTCQPMMILDTESLLPILGNELNSGGKLDVGQNIGWTKCTAREKFKIFTLFKKPPKKPIRNFKQLENSYSESELKKFRMEIFGSETGAKDRMPDIHLKLLAAFAHTCITDLREAGYLGESDILQEAEIYKAIGQDPGDENLLRMIYFGKKQTTNVNEVSGYYLVMEFASGGSFIDHLKKVPEVSINDAIQYSMQLCKGLASLNKKHIIHRDFKLDNILIGQDDKLKISDFGTACSTKNIKGSPGNPDAMPPETNVPGQSQEKYDSWGLGFAMLTILAKKDLQKKIDELLNIIDPIKKSYQNALLLKDSVQIEKAEKRLLECLLSGNDGQQTHGCGIRNILPNIENNEQVKAYTDIIIGLLHPDPSKRTSAADAFLQLDNIN